MVDAAGLHDAFVGGGDLGGRNDDGAGDALTLDGDELRLLLGVEEFVGVFEAGDFHAIDFVDHLAGVSADVSGEGIAFDAGENDDVLAFLEDRVLHVVLVGLADAGVAELVGGVEVEVEWLEGEAAEEDEAGAFAVAKGEDPGGGEGGEGDGGLFLFAGALEFEFDRIAFEFPFDDFVEDDLFTVDVDVSGIVDWFSIDGEEHIAGLEDFVAGAFGSDRGDHDADAVVGQLEGAAHGGVEEGELGGAKVDVVIVFAVFDVLEEASDDGSGDHVAGVVGLAEALEGDADDFVILEDRSAGVAGVDGGVDLDDEVGVDLGVRVGAEVDAGNDAAGDRDAIAADGVTDDADLAFKLRDVTEVEVAEAGEGGGVLYFQNGEVTVVGDVNDLGGVFNGRSAFVDEDPAGVGDDVCVGEKPVGADEESRAGAAAEASGVPWSAVVGDLGRHLDAHYGAVDIGGIGWRGRCVRGQAEGVGGRSGGRCLGGGGQGVEDETAEDQQRELHKEGTLGRFCGDGRGKQPEVQVRREAHAAMRAAANWEASGSVRRWFSLSSDTKLLGCLAASKICRALSTPTISSWGACRRSRLSSAMAQGWQPVSRSSRKRWSMRKGRPAREISATQQK